MPRIYRVRVHNIHFEAGGQPRLYHDTVFEPRGESSLLLLGNGGGKTLLLHLLAQVVEPNVPLQERRIKRLVQKEKFTGHVLVEWLLDGEMPRFLLTGFCFADHLGGAHREMDYFNYLHEYGSRNDWDLLSFPLTDEKGRTLNLKQLSDRLAESPVKVYHHYRRQEYQEKLKSFHVDPREWKYILRINDSEGGVEKFFEGCSKTRTLMDRLLIPMVDEVLERREEHDPLREAFRSTAREVMILPELKVQSEALQALAGRLPRLIGELNGLAGAVAAADALRVWQERALQTILGSLPLLAEEKEALGRQLQEKERGRERARLGLQAVEVERKRREWAGLEQECQQRKNEVQAAQGDWQQRQEHFQKLRACRHWGRILGFKTELAARQEELRRQEEGDKAFFRRLEMARKEVAPLLRRGLEEAEKQAEQLFNVLLRLEREKIEFESRRDSYRQELQGIEKNLFHLQQQELEFKEEQQKAVARVQTFGVSLPVENPPGLLADCRKQIKILLAAAQKEEEQIRQAVAARQEWEEKHGEARLQEKQLAQNYGRLEEAFQGWREEVRLLQADLRIGGCAHDPGENGEAARVWLLQKEEQLLAGLREGDREKYRLTEQQRLWHEGEILRPNLEISRVVEMLTREGIAARPAVDLLQDLPETERRAMIENRPWLPYSVVVEPVQLQRLKEKNFLFPQELSVPVPLLSRSDFHAGATASGLYFLSHRGLELYISPAKAQAYFQKIESKLQDIREKQDDLQEQSNTVRELRGRLDGFRGKYPYGSALEWEKVLRQAEQELRLQQNSCREAARQLQQVREDLASRSAGLEKINSNRERLEKASACGEEYLERWEKSLQRRNAIKELEDRQKMIGEKSGAAERKIAERSRLLEDTGEAREKVCSTLERYQNVRDKCFPGGEALAAAAAAAAAGDAGIVAGAAGVADTAGVADVSETAGVAGTAGDAGIAGVAASAESTGVAADAEDPGIVAGPAGVADTTGVADVSETAGVTGTAGDAGIAGVAAGAAGATEGAGALTWGEEAAGLLEEKMTKLLALLAAAERSRQGYQETKQQIEKLRGQIKEQEADISILGQDLAAVAAYYRPVTDFEINAGRQEETRARASLAESQKKLQEIEIKTEAALQVFRDRFSRLQAEFPAEAIPDLARDDLAKKQKELRGALLRLQKEQEQLEVQKNEHAAWIEDYRRARDDLERKVPGLDLEAQPWGREEEESFLRGKALPAVKDNEKELEQASFSVQNKKQACVAALQGCAEELFKLHGDELKAFFHRLEMQMSSPEWERQIGELQGFLQQARQAIDHFQQQVRQRLAGATRKVEEIVRRSWRHVEGLLEQLRELQRRSAVPLRGERHHLFRIHFQKLAEEEGQKALQQYLENVIQEAARRREQGENDETVDDFLQDAVQTASLLNQVIPLDDFKIQLLKPRDDDGSYGSGRYDRWDDLNEWSQGQRFAGRFALFIVLLAYLRQCRAGGRKTWAAVLADNPFGKASSSHILEIISTISTQQNVQLFCCTALRNTEIMREFPVIYSLVPVKTMSGKERVRISSHYRHGEAYHVLERVHGRIPRDPAGEIGQMELF